MKETCKSYIRRYFEEPDFKSRVLLYRGAGINIIYAVFKLVMGIIYRSEWMIAIAVYYVILILLKLTLVRRDFRDIRQKTISDELSKWRSYRMVGWLMLLLNIGLSGITVQVVAQNRSFTYPGVLIFAIAAYSFYRFVIAITRLVKDRGNPDPLFSVAKRIDLCFAITSFFTLQTAMFASFSSGLNVRVPNIITGTAVAVIITVIAIIMIIRASRKLKV